MPADTPDPVARFTELVTAPAEPPLDRAVLALAAGADPALDPAPSLAELDRLAGGVGDLDGLRTRLFVEEGFAGAVEDYHDPRNSLLPEVLGRRRGIPITLAVVCIEVGRRAGLTLQGVGMPGHFLVRAPAADVLLDPFHGGRELDTRAAEALFRTTTGTGPEVPFGPALLPAVDTRAILARMLENLRAVHRDRPAQREWVLRMRLALPGVAAAHLLELGEAIGAQARWLEGARLLDTAAARRPADADALTLAAKRLRAHLN